MINDINNIIYKNIKYINKKNQTNQIKSYIKSNINTKDNYQEKNEKIANKKFNTIYICLNI